MSSSLFRRSLLLLLLALALPLSIGCQGGGPHGKSGEADADSSKVRPVPVETQTVVTAPMAARLHVNGVLATEREVQVFPQVTGHVARLLVEEGDRVAAGDTLLTLEDTELLLAERRQRLDRDKARADVLSIRALFADSLVSRQELTDAEFAAEQAQLTWESAALRLERSRVLAPIAGVVSRRNVQVGDYVSGVETLFTLVDDSEFISQLDVPERELSRLKAGQDVQVELTALGETGLKGWIKRIAPVVDPASGTVKVTVGLPNERGQLRAGMYARFSIITDLREDAVVIPKRSLVYDRDQLYVWVAGDSLAERRRVSKGYEDELNLEALEGVRPGESLVIVGQAGLKTGTPIKVIRDDGQDVASLEPEPAATSTDGQDQ